MKQWALVIGYLTAAQLLEATFGLPPVVPLAAVGGFLSTNLADHMRIYSGRHLMLFPYGRDRTQADLRGHIIRIYAPCYFMVPGLMAATHRTNMAYIFLPMMLDPQMAMRNIYHLLESILPRLLASRDVFGNYSFGLEAQFADGYHNYEGGIYRKTHVVYAHTMIASFLQDYLVGDDEAPYGLITTMLFITLKLWCEALNKGTARTRYHGSTILSAAMRSTLGATSEELASWRFATHQEEEDGPILQNHVEAYARPNGPDQDPIGAHHSMLGFPNDFYSAPISMRYFLQAEALMGAYPETVLGNWPTQQGIVYTVEDLTEPPNSPAAQALEASLGGAGA